MGTLAVGILASGSGTNFDSIAAAVEDGRIRARIALLLCNRPTAAVLSKAAARGIPTVVVDHRSYPSREAFDKAVASSLKEAGVDLVAMAGFDRLVTGTLLGAFPDRVVNIHPALLPSFRGTDAQSQAADYGVTMAGATVHFVDEHVDHGPIIVQGAVPVAPGEDAQTVRERILQVEHRIYPQALAWIAEGRVEIEGRHVRLRGRRPVGAESLISPALDD